MLAGYEFYDAAGNLITGPDDFVFKYLGAISVSSSSNPSGSISDGNLANSNDLDGWFMSTNGGGVGPEIVVTSSGVSWSNPWPAGNPWTGFIYYGFW